MKYLTTAFSAVLDWFEHGDLVPLIVVISAVHYSSILHEYDHIVPAVAIGTLVDLGHYRWTKAAVRYNGESWKEKAGRWFMVFVMSAIALNYQQRFYQDWWLSVPMPLLIASLAWLNQKDKTGTKSVITVNKSNAVKSVNSVKISPMVDKIDRLERAKAAKREKHTQQLAELSKLITENKDATPVELAQKMNVSRQSVYNWMRELTEMQADGTVHVNGNGVEVKE